MRREGWEGGERKVFLLEWAPLSSLPIVGRCTGSAGSASSAGRTWAFAAAVRLVCSLDRLTPTRWRAARTASTGGVTRGASLATTGLLSRPDCCSEDVPDEDGMWAGSAPRPDHLRRLGGGVRRGVARPAVAAGPGPVAALVGRGPGGPGPRWRATRCARSSCTQETLGARTVANRLKPTAVTPLPLDPRMVLTAGPIQETLRTLRLAG